MNENSLARRYTRAFVQTLTDEKHFRKAKDQLAAFQQVLTADAKLKTGLETFLLSSQKKQDVLALIGHELRLEEKTRRFLEILITENRLVLLKHIIEQMEDMWNETRGMEGLKVYSAIPLEKEQMERLKRQLEGFIGKEVVLRNAIDPRLLGGIKIQRGSITYDFSLQGNLQRLKEQIVEES